MNSDHLCNSCFDTRCSDSILAMLMIRMYSMSSSCFLGEHVVLIGSTFIPCAPMFPGIVRLSPLSSSDLHPTLFSLYLACSYVSSSLSLSSLHFTHQPSTFTRSKIFVCVARMTKSSSVMKRRRPSLYASIPKGPRMPSKHTHMYILFCLRQRRPRTRPASRGSAFTSHLQNSSLWNSFVQSDIFQR